MKLSQFADEHAPGRFQRYRAAIERHICDPGITYAFVRPNVLMQGLLMLRSTIASEGARPEALTHAEMADRLSEATGRLIRYVDIPSAAMRQPLIGFGMPAWQADGLVEDYEHDRRGEASVVTTTVRDVTENEPRTFSQFASEFAGAFGKRRAEAAAVHTRA